MSDWELTHEDIKYIVKIHDSETGLRYWSPQEVAHAAARKALWWAHRYLSNPDVSLGRNDLGPSLIEMGIKPWPDPEPTDGKLITGISPLFICAWCMPRGIPGTHGICPKCYKVQEAEIAATELQTAKLTLGHVAKAALKMEAERDRLMAVHEELLEALQLIANHPQSPTVVKSQAEILISKYGAHAQEAPHP